MRHAIVAIEDRRFWEHDGIDLRGIGRALIADIKHKKVVEGGSTITQQFVKNGLERDQKTIAPQGARGGVRVAARALEGLAQEADPDGVPEHDLLRERRLRRATGCADVLPPRRPEPDDPRGGASGRHPRRPEPLRPGHEPEGRADAARARAESDARAVDDHARAVREANAAKLPKAEDVRLPGTEGPAQHFVNYVKQQLIDEYGSAEVFGGGLKVRTTIDLDLQQKARDAISKWLTKPDGPSAALVAIDPRNGAVKAMVGGNNYRKSQFNLAVQGVRQPGSSFKPFVLATALREGISPATHFDVEAADDQPRRQVLGGQQLRQLVPRLDRPRATRRSSPTTRSTRS